MNITEMISGFSGYLHWIVTAVVVLIVLKILFKVLGIRFIANNKVGIVEKCIGKGKKDGGIIALNGETGFRAEVFRAGIHILPWPIYKLHKVNLITVPQGQIAYVFARNGKPLEQGQVAGKVIECSDFENVRAFLENGGQKGPQRAILREGTYAINLAQFIVIAKSAVYYMPLGIPGEDEQVEKMQDLIVERKGFKPLVVSDEKDEIAIVTVHDGPALPKDKLLAPSVEGHNSYQDIETFLRNGGYKGRQEDVLLDGTYFINRLVATVEMQKKTEIPIGQVGVVNCFTGDEGQDLSGENYSHGDLVENGKKGIWNEVLLPNKYAWNTYQGRIYFVPTINFVLNWGSARNKEFGYDDQLQEITLITKDAFQPSLPLSVVIHINYKDAPRVIQRFGDIKTLVEQTVDPMVGAYFKNIGQTKTLLELIQQRGEIQKQAKDEMARKFQEYDLNLEDVLIGTPRSPEEDKKNNVTEIYAQLQERQLAKETAITKEAQKEAQLKEQEFAKAEKAAQMQAELTKSEMQITITENKGKADVKQAEQDAEKLRINAKAEADKKKIDAEAEAERVKISAEANAAKVTFEAEADAKSIEKKGAAQADATARQGIAEAIAIQEKVRSMGSENYSATIIAKELGNVLASYTGSMVPSIVIGSADENGQGSAIAQIMTLLGLKAISPEFSKIIEANADSEEQSEKFREIAQKLYDEVLSKAVDEPVIEGDESEKAEKDEILLTEEIS